MTDRLVEILFMVTGVLLTPVLVVLAVMSAATLWMLGGLAREALERRRARSVWRTYLASLKAGSDEEGAAFRQLTLSGDPARFQAWFRAVDHRGQAGLRKGLDDLEIEMARRLSWLSFATRVGPMLGLVGTLLPLGPALRGLASEDLGSLAENLEIAFTSTVFGLLIGGLAYAASVLRRNWYDQDLSDLEFVLDTIRPKQEQACLESPIGAPADA
ncbi:outer membrane transport energization protein ExbB [Singulisphaera sp. GP187]|uniref:MotA/TolQ/ExbB proton channel family protein n=1 Tax=Singulisphaera sp. GP187 TaxID=1882752 RepID=UPI000927E980|nr:MotA/TolQ/ExbB proton channel family protein [Singulisphaera sp. GP187]SIO59450.1 outer membrane transport energization protein ExbB [Singulisphaera sp. GP187]